MRWLSRIGWLFSIVALAAVGACAGGGCSRGGTPVDTMQKLRARVITKYPHDKRAFTQGLEMHRGQLYEGTGNYGHSTIRRVNMVSGAVEDRGELPSGLFGEGITRVGHYLLQLTWREGRAVVWDIKSLEPVKEFRYQGEGWGLCFDGTRLIMSNGTSRLTFRDPNTFDEMGGIDVTRDGAPLGNLNELECVDGQVYANVWQTENIARIDPQSGFVTAWIDASGLLAPSERMGTDVMNGIARIEDSDRFLVTGKNWPYLFEVEFVPQ